MDATDDREDAARDAVTVKNTAYAIAVATARAPVRCASDDCVFCDRVVPPGWLYWSTIALDPSTGADGFTSTHHLACVSQRDAHDLCASFGFTGGDDVLHGEAVRCAQRMRGYADLPPRLKFPFSYYIAALVRGDAKIIAKHLHWVAPLRDIHVPTTEMTPPAMKMTASPKLKTHDRVKAKHKKSKKMSKKKRKHRSVRRHASAPASSSKALGAPPEKKVKTEVKVKLEGAAESAPSA